MGDPGDRQPSELQPRTREPTRRLFFALWPDDAQRLVLADATHKAATASGGRPIPVENLHITMAFLGSVPERRLPEVSAMGSRSTRALAAEGAQLSVTFDRLDYWKKPQILCAIANEEPRGAQAGARTGITALAEALRTERVRSGFAPDASLVDGTNDQPFRPHVTVVRKVVHPPRSMTMRPVTWTFTDVTLLESRTAPEGAVYRVLEAWRWVDVGSGAP